MEIRTTILIVMKKILISLLTLISFNVFSQSVDIIRQDTIKHVAKGNNTRSYHDADLYVWETNKDGFNFNKPITINNVPIAVDSLYHSDTQTWLLNGDTIPKADSSRITFTADTIKTTVINGENLFLDLGTTQKSGALYLGTTNPIGTTRLNIDFDVYSTGFKSGNEGAGSFNSNYPLHISSDAYGSQFYANGDDVIRVFATGSVVDNQNYNILNLRRQYSGNYDFTGDLISIIDNPTTTGTISGKLLSATIGSTERVSLNPRATTGEVYLFDSHSDVSSFTHTSWENQGVAIATLSGIGQLSTGEILVDSIGFKDGSGYITGVDTTGFIQADSLSIGGGDVIISSDTITLKTAVELESFDKITLNAVNPTESEGVIQFDTNDRAFVGFNGITGFKEEFGRGVNIIFYNSTGSTLNDGTIIRSVGAKVNGSITFIADLAGIGSLDSLNGIAMVTSTTLNNTFGVATLIGQVNNLNTSIYRDNQILYASYAGGYDTIRPEAPNIAQIVGRVQYPDADSGTIYFYGFSESGYDPTPDISASFTRQTATITNPGLNVPALITNGTNNLYTVDYNVGFQEVGDSIAPLQAGIYDIVYSDAFQGDAATGDEWRIGIFINGVELHTVLRTSSSSNKGVVASSKIVSLETTDWVTIKIINTTNATRSSIFTDGVINIKYISAQ